MTPRLHLAASSDGDSALGRVQRELAQTRLALTRCRLELAEARQAVHTDTLTGLPNRSGFATESRQTMAAHDGGTLLLALLFVDLDGFKAINDRLGHTVGDHLLRIVGARLSQALRHGDTAYRHGVDEFLCLLPHLPTAEQAETIARHLARSISAPCQLGPQGVRVRASIGIAIYPPDGNTLAALLGQADRAMYTAKAAGCSVTMAAPSVSAIWA